jgi:hypothetical protein
MDVAQDRGFAELGRRSRMKLLLFGLGNSTSETSVAMLGDMASYLRTRRRHVRAALPELGGLLVSP